MLTLEGYAAGGGETKYRVVKKPAPAGSTQSFFRKPYRGGDDAARNRGWKIEHMIATALYRHPQPNVIRVLAVTPTYIDYQLVQDDLHPSRDDPDAARQVRNGLRNLHRLGFVYVDLHQGNVVWDGSHNEWVIIDFDLCGKMDETHRRWLFKPDSWRQMRIATYSCNSEPYNECDFADSADRSAVDECVRMEKSVIERLRRLSEVRKLCGDADLTRIDKIVFFNMFGRDFDSLRLISSPSLVGSFGTVSPSPSPPKTMATRKRRASPSPMTPPTTVQKRRRRSELELLTSTYSSRR
jgi:hypothetical protein